MIVEAQLAVEVKDSAVDPDSADRTVLVRDPKGNSPFYRVFLYLDGPDLPFVEAVTYQLHPSFANSVQRVSRTPANPRCKLQIWTWGIFNITATITDRQGGSHVRYHDLQYDKIFSDASVKFQAA